MKAAWTAEFGGDKSKRRYAHEDIRAALQTETNGKCAYCQSDVEHVSYIHVEHILPKALFPLLVVDWNNLTLACQICNVRKGTDFDASCMLLNPYVDNPDDHLYWLGPMLVDKASGRGRRTISQIDLNRAELLFKRVQQIQRAKDILALISGSPAAVQAALRCDLQHMTRDGAEFSAAVRAFLLNEGYVCP